MKKTKLLIFDLDGTLVDTSRDLTTAVNLTLEDFKLPPVSVDHVKKHIGFGVRRLLKEMVGTTDAYENFEWHYMANVAEHSYLYDEVRELLEKTSHFEKVILTNKMQVFLEPLLQALGIRDYFSGVYGLEAFPTSKPDPWPVLEIARIHGYQLNQMLIIGDTEADIRAGQAAGIRTCAVNWGYGDINLIQSLSPTFLISNANANELKIFLDLFIAK